MEGLNGSGASYASYGNMPSYGYGAATGQPATLRRRHMEMSSTPSGPDSGKKGAFSPSNPNVVKKLDFMFPKVDAEYTVQTDGGGVASLVAYILVALLVLAEGLTWMAQNRETREHILVDTSLGHRMRVNINVTFPALACEDLHVDVMDVAGDSQLDIEDTLVKQRLDLRGRLLGKEEKVESNAHFQQQQEKDQILTKPVPPGYCGPCYGAHLSDDQCCNTCDELIQAYKLKRWKYDSVVRTSEQCIREGRDKVEPKRMTPGQGCNLSGYLIVNRVAGNFHIAMGEGVERDGRHIHTFVPDDTPNFNASHIIHHLSFGPNDTSGVAATDGYASLSGVKKIVTKEYGTTGLFQYFIKVVPTTYIKKGGALLLTNRYFYTERFRPLMSEYLEEEAIPEGQDKKAVNAGHSGGHSNHAHHDVRNAVLPGVFFIYEIYPFAVEITSNSVPFTHLLIRLMATVGGVFTLVKLADSMFFSRTKSRR